MVLLVFYAKQSTKQNFLIGKPLRHAYACHLPLAGEGNIMNCFCVFKFNFNINLNSSFISYHSSFLPLGKTIIHIPSLRSRNA